jgi:hypothetical protein
MAADAAPAGDVSAAVAGSHHHGHEVTLKAPRQATKGEKVTLKGKVKKNRHHKTRVVIQKKHGKKWQKLDSTKTNKKGTFKKFEVLKGKNKVTLRAKAKGHGTSATQKVTLTKASNGTPTQPGQSGPSGVTPGGGTNNPPPPPPDPMSIPVPAGNVQALRDAITQAPKGATLHLSGQYKLTTDMPGPKGTGYAAGVVIDRALTLDGGKLISDGSDNVVDVTDSGDLTLTGGIWVTGGHADKNGGGIYNAGNVTLNDGYIWGNEAEDNGGGVYNLKDAIFTLNGGEVGSHKSGDGNDATDGAGIYNNGKVNLNGGTINGNRQPTEGGGIYNSSTGMVTLNGGTITLNQAGYKGGGIYNDGGKVNLKSGEITGNIASYQGGGIYNTNQGTVLNSTGIPVSKSDLVFGNGSPVDHDNWQG